MQRILLCPWQYNQEIMENDLYLESIKQIDRSVEVITETLLLLKDKRVTLEEKMIRDYLHQLAEKLANTTASIHRFFRLKNYDIEEDLVIKIAELAKEIEGETRRLLKIVNYDLNFLEQYFEHDYFAQLNNELRFLERLESLTEKLKI